MVHTKVIFKLFRNIFTDHCGPLYEKTGNIKTVFISERALAGICCFWKF